MNSVTPTPTRAFPSPSRMSVPQIKSTLLKYKWAIIFIAIGAFLFYWYQIRPIQTYRFCATQASLDARKLLTSKAQIAKGTEQGKAYATMVQKNMYLRSDYESFVRKCLLYYGFQMQSVSPQSPSAKDSGTESGKSVKKATK